MDRGQKPSKTKNHNKRTIAPIFSVCYGPFLSICAFTLPRMASYLSFVSMHHSTRLPFRCLVFVRERFGRRLPLYQRNRDSPVRYYYDYCYYHSFIICAVFTVVAMTYGTTIRNRHVSPKLGRVLAITKGGQEGIFRRRRHYENAYNKKIVLCVSFVNGFKDREVILINSLFIAILQERSLVVSVLPVTRPCISTEAKHKTKVTTNILIPN